MATTEDISALITTVVETGNDVRWLRRAMTAQLEKQGLVVDPE